MGTDSEDEKGPGQFLVQGRAEAHREIAATQDRQDVVLPFTGGSDEDPKVSRTFYIAVTQPVLLFGSETWVLTARMERALDTFQSRVARKLTGR